jgi:hypothetical protein
MISKKIVYQNRLTISIAIFTILMMLIHYIKPMLIYDKDGSFREFGIGYQNKTIIPIWLVSASLAILSYLVVSAYLYR